jgi:hypothetical protein
VRWHKLRPGDTLVGDSGVCYAVLRAEPSVWQERVCLTMLNLDTGATYVEDVLDGNTDFFTVYRRDGEVGS